MSKRVLLDKDFKKHGFVKERTVNKHTSYLKKSSHNDFTAIFTDDNMFYMMKRVWGDRKDPSNTYLTQIIAYSKIKYKSDLSFFLSRCPAYYGDFKVTRK